MKAMLKSVVTTDAELTGMHDGIRGDVTGIRGGVTDIRGDVSGLYGDVTGIRGDLDACELTDEDRDCGIDLHRLIG
jgi:hypothetical protein